jgi:hypothetical protein
VRAVVTGYIATFPVGGVFWDYVQYALGLERLGWEVWYLEDSGTYPYVMAGEEGVTDDWAAAAGYLRDALGAVSPTLGERWCLRATEDDTLGVERDELVDLVAGADLLLNVSATLMLRPEYLPCPRKVLIDTDPGWNQFRWADKDEPTAWGPGWGAHDAYFTYAERMGRPDCLVPSRGVSWHPTRPPVVLDCWAEGEAAGDSWTTLLSWNNFAEPVEHGGVTYGSKEREFPRIADLPARVDAPLELAAGGVDPPMQEWRARGWSVVDGPAVSATPDAYRRYVQGSRGELSVAKHVYVAARTGWFSCRSTCYLAAGRPVVVQDTGFSEVVPTGQGLFAFTDGDEAAAAVAAVEADWDRHAAAARDVAERHFAAETVLTALLERLE